jgi:hypothetical protein
MAVKYSRFNVFIKFLSVSLPKRLRNGRFASDSETAVGREAVSEVKPAPGSGSTLNTRWGF